jgi:hypothetical protein
MGEGSSVVTFRRSWAKRANPTPAAGLCHVSFVSTGLLTRSKTGDPFRCKGLLQYQIRKKKRWPQTSVSKGRPKIGADEEERQVGEEEQRGGGVSSGRAAAGQWPPTSAGRAATQRARAGDSGLGRGRGGLGRGRASSGRQRRSWTRSPVLLQLASEVLDELALDEVAGAARARVGEVRRRQRLGERSSCPISGSPDARDRTSMSKCHMNFNFF